MNFKSFKNKDFHNLILFVMGKGISVFGSSIYNFAISLYVLKITGSALNFATTLLLGIVPMILISPFAGIFVDRFSKKNIIIVTDVLNALLFFTLYLMSTSKDLSLGAIYVTTVFLAIFSTLFGLSMEAAKPQLVSPEKLLKINAISKMIDSTSTILGPILGGIAFVVFEIRFFILINAISFLFSATTECFLVFKKSEVLSPKQEKTSLSLELNEGIQYLKASTELKKLTSVFIFINFFLGFSIQVPLPYIINTVLSLSSKWFGFINSAFPIGMIVGSLLVERLLIKIDYNTLLMRMVFIMAFCSLFVGLPLLFDLSKEIIAFIYLLIMFLLGITIALIDIPIMYRIQSAIPEYIRGRILSLITSLVKIVLPISLFLSGTLLQYFPPHYLPISGGIMALLYTLGYYYFISLKADRQLPLIREVGEIELDGTPH